MTMQHLWLDGASHIVLNTNIRMSPTLPVLLKCTLHEKKHKHIRQHDDINTRAYNNTTYKECLLNYRYYYINDHSCTGHHAGGIRHHSERTGNRGTH